MNQIDRIDQARKEQFAELEREFGIVVAVKTASSETPVPAQKSKKGRRKKTPEALTEIPVPAVSASKPGAVAALLASPHLLDLGKRETAEDRPKQTSDKNESGAGWFDFLGDRNHRLDMHHRTLSVRSRNRNDFPPAGANTMVEAIIMWLGAHAARRFPWLRPAKLVQKKPAVLRAGVSAAVRQPPTALPEAPAKNPTAYTFEFAFPASWKKNVIGFAILSLALVLPFAGKAALSSMASGKNEIEASAKDAAAALAAAGEAAVSNDFENAQAAFQDAAREFTEAEQRLGVVGDALRGIAAVLPARRPFSAAPSVLDAGKEISAGGAELTAAFAALDSAGNPVEKIEALRSHFTAALPRLESANASLARVAPSAIPADYREGFVTAKRELPRLAKNIAEAISLSELLRLVAGAESPKRYLVLFQNNAEIRPTGGFIGSFALVDVKKGEVAAVEIPGGGSYDLKGSLRLKVSSPQPLHLINPVWQFQDANWSPDFPTSAKNLARFYEKSGGPTTDGVIAINMSLMEKILAATGPIEMREYGKTITAANFYYETQKEVELDYDKAANKPKKFIADLAPRVLQRLLSADRAAFAALAIALQDGLSSKDLQLWFRDERMQSAVASRGWDGAIAPADGDSLAIIHANIAGQKTDLVMKESVDHRAKILADGSAIVTLTIRRTHTGLKNALFSGVRNVDYLRVYVPLGSELVEATGFSPPDAKLFKMTPAGFAPDEAVAEQERLTTVHRASSTNVAVENGQTVFGNWLQTDPGQTSTAIFVYKLPPKVIKLQVEKKRRWLSVGKPAEETRTLSYSLLVRKQSGANAAEFTSSVDLPRGFNAAWQSPERSPAADGTLSARRTVNRDAFFGLVAIKKGN